MAASATGARILRVVGAEDAHVAEQVQGQERDAVAGAVEPAEGGGPTLLAERRAALERPGEQRPCLPVHATARRTAAASARSGSSSVPSS